MIKRGCQVANKICHGFTVSASNRLKNALTNLFGKYLAVTNIVSSGVLMLMGDVMEQKLNNNLRQQGDSKYDYERSARMFLVGLSSGPVHHYYYGYLARRWPERTIKNVSRKILLDQFLGAPVFIAQFFYILGILERKPLKQIHSEFKDKFVSVYTMDWFVWPPSQFINFYYMPRRYQVLYINFITMVYDVFLSYIKHDAE